MTYACGRKLGRFVPRHEYLSFFVKRKVPKKTTQTYGLRIPWRAVGYAKLAVLISRNWLGGGRCRFGGLLVPLAPLPLTAVRVGVGALLVFGDYQIAPIAARSTAMGRWRLTPPGYWGHLSPCGSVHGSDTPPACHSIPRTHQGGRLGGGGGRSEKCLPWLRQAAASASAPVSVHAVLLTDNSDERLCPRENAANHCRV